MIESEYYPSVRHEREWTSSHSILISSSSLILFIRSSFIHSTSLRCFIRTLRKEEDEEAVSIDKISEIVSSGWKVVLGSWNERETGRERERWERRKKGRDEEEIAFFGMSTRWQDYKGKDVICSSTHDNGFAASSFPFVFSLLFHH